MSNFWRLHQEGLGSLTAAEQKVASWLKVHEEQALAISIKSLSVQAEVSEPTVMRFCRKLGFDGFSSLKIALAQQSRNVSGAEQKPDLFQYGSMQLQREDSSEVLVSKILHNALSDITWLKNQAVANSIEVAVQMIQQASKIECFGLGGSAIAVTDAVFKLNRLGYNAHSSLSLHDYHRSFVNWPEGRTLLLFSRNSQGHIVEMISEAMKYNISIVLVGPMDPDLMRNASSKLALVETRGDFCNTDASDSITEEELSDTILSPIKSRLMQILVVDMITSILGLKHRMSDGKF